MDAWRQSSNSGPGRPASSLALVVICLGYFMVIVDTTLLVPSSLVLLQAAYPTPARRRVKLRAGRVCAAGSG